MIKKLTLVTGEEITLFPASSILVNYKRITGKSIFKGGLSNESEDFEENLFLVLHEAAKAGAMVSKKKFDLSIDELSSLLPLSDAVESLQFILGSLTGDTQEKKIPVPPPKKGSKN